MRDNQYIDSLICSELEISNYFDLSDWNYDCFIGKINEIIQSHKKIPQESLSKEDIKEYKRAQRGYIKRLHYIKRNYTPIKMKLKLKELNNVGTFVSLRMDFLEIKNILKNIDNHDIEKECDKYIEKYNLDQNKHFIKSHEANLQKKDVVLLSQIGSWMNGYIEYFYDNSLMNNDIAFDENLDISVKTTYLLEKSEIGEKIKNNIKTKLRKTWDFVLYFALLLISIVLFIVGTYSKNDVLQGLIYSLAITFLATFLINILNNIKHSYYNYRVNQIKYLLADIANCKKIIDNCFEDYKGAKHFKEKIEVFLDYKCDIEYYLKYIKKLLRIVSISGEPFTNNYFSLKRYYEYIMSPLYSNAKYMVELKDDNFTLIKCKKDVVKNIEDGIKESFHGIYLIISDLYETIQYSIEDKLSYYEKLKK